MSGRSVRWTCAEKVAAPAMPTRPVPAPSSRMRGLWLLDTLEGVLEGVHNAGRDERLDRRLARRYDASQVLWPRLSAVSEGSWRIIEIGGTMDVDFGVAVLGMVKVREVDGAAVCPGASNSSQLTLSHSEAIGHGG